MFYHSVYLYKKDIVRSSSAGKTHWVAQYMDCSQVLILSALWIPQDNQAVLLCCQPDCPSCPANEWSNGLVSLGNLGSYQDIHPQYEFQSVILLCATCIYVYTLRVTVYHRCPRVHEWRLFVSQVQEFAERAQVTKLDSYKKV